MITITWHLLLMIIITVILGTRIFGDSDGDLDFSGALCFILIVLMWLIYGGIFLW